MSGKHWGEIVKTMRCPRDRELFGQILKPVAIVGGHALLRAPSAHWRQMAESRKPIAVSAIAAAKSLPIEEASVRIVSPETFEDRPELAGSSR